LPSYFLNNGVARPTVCVRGQRAGVDSAWEQEKFEARKRLNLASHPTASPQGLLSGGLTLTRTGLASRPASRR